MDLINLKNGKVIAQNVFVAQTVKERTQGLIGKDAAIPMYFKTKWGIHTFGVKFPIDVLICNEKVEVMKIFEQIQPGKIVFWQPIWDNVFELPAGAIEQSGIALGDRLEILEK